MNAEVAKNVGDSVGASQRSQRSHSKAMDADLQRMDRFVQEIGSKMSTQERWERGGGVYNCYLIVTCRYS